VPRETVEAVDSGVRSGADVRHYGQRGRAARRYCDRYLSVSIESSSIAGSYVAAMALNAIIVACASQSPKRSLAALRNTREEHFGTPLVSGRARAGEGL
jgi:predicted phage gp36 major capsid-like protein